MAQPIFLVRRIPLGGVCRQLFLFDRKEGKFYCILTNIFLALLQGITLAVWSLRYCAQNVSLFVYKYFSQGFIYVLAMVAVCLLPAIPGIVVVFLGPGVNMYVTFPEFTS